jgi:leader peptidase (prepilin peptidase) / N-methyltransferase
MTASVVAICAVVGIPVGWLAWRVAQTFIDARSLEEGDTELRLPWPTAVVLEVVVFAGLGWRFADSPRLVLLIYLALFAAFTALLLIDFGRYYLPNPLVGGTLVVGGAAVVGASLVVHSPMIPPDWTIGPVVAGVVINLVIYFVFWLLAQIAFGSRGLGFGDVKLSAPLGLAIGWIAPGPSGVLRLAFWALLIGFASGAISSVVLLRGVKMRQSFPQGPFLVLGTWVVVVFSSTFLG